MGLLRGSSIKRFRLRQPVQRLRGGAAAAAAAAAGVTAAAVGLGSVAAGKEFGRQARGGGAHSNWSQLHKRR